MGQYQNSAKHSSQGKKLLNTCKHFLKKKYNSLVKKSENGWRKDGAAINHGILNTSTPDGGLKLKSLSSRLLLILISESLDAGYISIQVCKTALYDLKVFLIYGQIQLIDACVRNFGNKGKEIVPIPVHSIRL